MTASTSSGSAVLELSRRAKGIAPSATLAVDAKAKALRAQGEPVIGFGGGEPDFPTADYIVEAAVAACRDDRNYRYSPGAGLPELRKVIAGKTLRDSGVEVVPEQVVVTNGGKHAIFNAFQVLLNPGDEVLLPVPYWTTYPEPIGLCGAVPVKIPTTVESGYRVSVEQLEAAWTPRTKALVFVSPSNPTGSVYPPEEVAAIGEWACERGLWVMADEIYEHLVYDDNIHCSIAVAVPEVAERCVVLNGVAKTYAMTGWRVGWMVAPLEFARVATNLQSHQTSNICNIAQRAAIVALAGPLDRFKEMHVEYNKRRLLMHSMLSGIPGVNCPAPQGAFYAFPSVEKLLESEIAGRRVASTVELAELLLSEIKVAVVPGEAFGMSGSIRLSFALGTEQIQEGLGRLVDFLS